jgi:hypothetical protein
MAGEKTALEIASQARSSDAEEEIEQIDMLASLGLPINENVIEAARSKAHRSGPARGFAE